MSFSEEIKSEIARKLPDEYHCLLAEIAAVIHYAGTITGNAENGTIAVETENVILAKKYLRLIRKAFEIPVNLDIRTSQGGKSRHYLLVLSSEKEVEESQAVPDGNRMKRNVVCIPEENENPVVSAKEGAEVSLSGTGFSLADGEGNSAVQEVEVPGPGTDVPRKKERADNDHVLAELPAMDDVQKIAAGDSFGRVWRETADWEAPGFKECLLSLPCCRRAFIRGAFLTSGSMSNPGKSYHFEIVCRRQQGAEELCEAAQTFGIYPKIVRRKTKYIVYLKDSESIVDMLNVMDAPNALMKLENVRIIKDMKNSANRQYNCDSANINKMVRTAHRQMEDIRLIAEKKGLDYLSPQLKEMALVRLEHPEESLAGLGQYLNPPVGKSGVNHRLKKLSEIAASLREESEE